MVFETCPPETVSENELGETCSTTEQAFVDKFCSHESTVSEALWEETNEEPVEVPPSKTEMVMNLEEEIVKCEKEEEEVKPLSGTVPNKDEGDNWEMPTTMESKAQKVGVDENGNNNNEERDLPKLSHFLGKISVDKDENGGERENADSPKSNGEISLGSLGSMRKEKEWRRTLACKLFEERHNVAGEVGGGGRCGGGEEGGERMDLLWEAYESQTDKTPLRSEEKKKQTTKKKEKQKKKEKNIEEIYKDEAHHHHHDDGDDNDNGDDDGDGDGDEQLCCLHALKFSTGKMHLGIARPNFLKLSKAFKGFGRFHSVSKHSKKT